MSDWRARIRERNQREAENLVDPNWVRTVKEWHDDYAIRKGPKMRKIPKVWQDKMDDALKWLYENFESSAYQLLSDLRTAHLVSVREQNKRINELEYIVLLLQSRLNKADEAGRLEAERRANCENQVEELLGGR